MTDQKANKFNAHDNDESLMLPLSLPLHQDITHPQYLERGESSLVLGEFGGRGGALVTLFCRLYNFLNGIFSQELFRLNFSSSYSSTEMYISKVYSISEVYFPIS